MGRRHTGGADHRIPRRAVARYRRQPSHRRRKGNGKIPAFELRDTGNRANGGRFEGLHQTVGHQGYADHRSRYGTAGLYLSGKRKGRSALGIPDQVGANMHDPTRRDVLAAGAAATALATTPALFAQQTGPGGTGGRFYEKGSVRIYYEEAGSGFPLLLIAGGGLNSNISGLISGSPFNPVEEFKPEYRCIFADLGNANPGQSSGPL